MGLLKTLSVIILWIDFIRKNRETLKQFNLKSDWIWRLYGIVTVPEDIRIYKEYTIDYLKNYSSNLDKFLTEKGMLEIAYPSRLDLISNGSYLVVIELKQIKLSKLANIMVYGIFIPLVIILISLSLYFLI